ncbi:MAG: hypothetical protein VBE63_15850 [Lamprobacter sp.]|uniref:hypothetical protein n=1 Tax=Lamprobacter sp. TaxID=3100796 RepID=UPI002B259D02|nr:hypothetical protein [Lamprobacter sp.]MEA3641398.1 hypothetical protein [Lamprobacter sp.]
MTEEPKLDPSTRARYEEERFPQSYESWRYCIEHKCGLRLTPDYIQQRISILTDPQQEETRRFARTYGKAYLTQVVAWFERAAAAC